MPSIPERVILLDLDQCLGSRSNLDPIDSANVSTPSYSWKPHATRIVGKAKVQVY